MKSKHLLLMLLMALLVPWVANAQTSLWSEDFEDGSMPTGWTTDGSGSWTVGTGDYSTSTGAGHGSYNAMITHGTTGAVTKLITPEIDLSSVTSAELSFMHVQRSWSGDIDQLKVYYRTSSSDSWHQLVAYTTAFASWTTESGIVLPTPSSTYQLAFEYKDNYGYGVGVDNIVIVPGASCPRPAGIVATPNGQNVTLTWTSDATSFSVAHSMDASATPADNIVATVSTPTCTLNDLTLNEDHYFWVRANCSGTEQSDWSDPASVHIGYCVPAPTSIDGSGISNVTFGKLPNTVNDNLSMTASPYYYDHSSQAGDAWLGNSVEIKITYATNYSYYTWVWVDWDNDLAFSDDEQVYAATSTISSGILTITFPVPATQALGNYRMRIQGADGSGKKDPCFTGTYSYLVDYTLSVIEAPSCLPPTNLNVSRNGNIATATWEGDGVDYNIDINGTVTNNVTSPYQFTVELSTDYAVKVMTNCEGDDTSGWTDPFNFSTPDCWNGHTIEYSLTDSYGDGWNGASITFIEGCNKNTLTCNGSSTSGTLVICEDYFAFVWNSGNYDSECGFTFTEGGTTLFTKPSPLTDGLVLYTFGEQSCITPTGLAAGTPEKRSVELNWTSEADAWQICVNGDEDNLIDVTEKPYTLPNLTPATAYTVKIRTNCGDEQSCWSDEIGFTTALACPAPTNLTSANVKSTQVDLSWTTGGAEDWVLAYKKTNDENFTEVNLGTNDVTIEGTTVTYTLTGLDEATAYTVKVQDNCEASYAGDGQSAWTATTSFTTMAACAVENVTVGNIGHYTATVNWDGESNKGFTVMYRTAEHIDGVNEDFSGTSLPTDWTMYTGQLSGNTATLSSSTYSWAFGTNHGVFDSHARVNIYGSQYRWLITPEITLADNAGLSFDMALTCYSSSSFATETNGTDDKFIVLISTDDMATWINLREWNNSGSSYVYNNIANTTTGENVNINLSTYAGQTVYIAFYGESTTSNADNYLHIDNVNIGVTVPAGSWQENDTNESPYIISGLEPGTKYDLKVAPICDETLVSEIQQFTTASENEKYFITEGNWGTAANWEPAGVPTIEQTVELRANATIESGCVAEAKSISGTGTGDNAKTLTIEDGGQLMHNSSNVRATVKKNITGYTDEWDHYYLISNPLTSTVYNHTSSNTPNISTTGMLTDAYDLYDWSYSNEGQEWRNYEASTFNLSTGLYGYLYASATDNELTFTGTVRASNNSQSRSTNASSYYAWGNWSLLGNPFVCNAYLVGASTNGTSLPYYRLTADGFEAVESGAIAPMEGFFYENTSGSSKTVYMIRTAPDDRNNGTLNMNLRGNNKQLDNAIIRFGEGEQLGKFSFREGSSKIYIPMDGKDFAIVNAGQVGEMPVSFKAEHNGSYTMSFTSKEVSFSYLHLIDNMTGADVDLLANPSYSFDAQTTDYASRFRLVFATGSSVDGDNFGFINGMGNLCIFGIEGEATVQVIDVLGHVISSDSFSGSYEQKLNVAPGVYMIRLINGNDVKVQKIIVR